MEFILELLFDIIVEGSIELSTEKKVPAPIRIIAFLIVLTIYLGMGWIFIALGYEAYIANDNTFIILFAVGLFIFCGGIYITHKMFRKKREQEVE